MSLESVFKLSLIMNMVDHLTGPMASVQSSVDGSVSRLQAANSAFGSMISTGSAMATMGEGITSAVLAPVEATFATRRAIGELASLGVKDLETIENAARSFSDTWAGTTAAEFITAAYDIKSGISSLTEQGIADYTEMASMTALATKASAGEMTSLFATGYGIYKKYYGDLSDMEFAELFSAGIADSVRAFKTSGSGMAEAISSLGASATNAQVPLEEQLAVLGMLQATMSGSEAGTKYNGFIRSAVKGGEELGLSFMDANNQLLSLPEILDKLRGKFGDTIDAAEKMEIQKAFGDIRAVQFIDLMYDKADDLQGEILGLYSSMGEGRAVAERMASAINNMEPAKYEVLQQQIQNTKEAIGESLLPTVNELLGKGSELFSKARDWIGGNQELVRVIMLVALGLGGFLTVAGTAIAVVGGVGLIFTKTTGLVKGFIGILGKLPGAIDTIRLIGMYTGDYLKKGFLLAKGALSPLIGSVWKFTAALLANPITWIVIGIVALIAAIYLLWTRCEWFRDGVMSVVNFIKEKVGAAIEFVQNLLTSIGSFVGSIFGTIQNTVSEKLSSIKSTYEQHGGGIKGVAAVAMEGVKGIFSAGYSFLDNLTGGRLTSIKEKFTQGLNNIKTAISGKFTEFKESGKRLVTTFTDGIKSSFTGAVDAVKGGLQKIRNLLPFSDAKEGPLSTLTLSGQRTMTTYAQGLLLAQDAPAEAVEKGLQRTEATLERAPVRRVEAGTGRKPERASDGGGSGGRDVIIQKLLIPVDLKKIKDLQQLLELLKEVEDYIGGNGEDTSSDPDAVPTPA